LVAVSGSVGGLGLVLSGYGSVVVSVLVLVLVQELVSCALPVQELAVERRLAPLTFNIFVNKGPVKREWQLAVRNLLQATFQAPD
jgi:hypothetical protein